MNAENENLFYKKLILTISRSLFLITFFIVMYRIAMRNPDNDAYWLVATGRYIIENHTFPKINPWVYNSEFKIIIQQPICAILNYIFYSISNNISTLWILATFLNVIMVMSMMYLSKKMDYSLPSTLISICIAELYCLVFDAITTRPFQMTISMSVILLANLEMARKNKSYKRAAISVALVTLWQANFQMATLIAIPLFISCYTVGGLCNHFCAKIRKANQAHLSIIDCLKGISLYAIWAICSLINPYGLDGALYLLKSQEAMKMCKNLIFELKTVPIWSLYTLCILLIVIIFIFDYIKNFYEHFEKVFLVCGCSLAAMMAVRNYWMVIVTIIIIVPPALQRLMNRLILLFNANKVKDAEDSQKPFIPTDVKESRQKRIFTYINLATLISALACFALSISSTSFSAKKTDAFVSVINSIPADASIFTTLNTGGLVEFAGRKIYMDARPELFSTSFTNGENRLLDWVYISYSDEETIAKVIQDHSFDYFVLDPNSPIEKYLTDSGIGKMIHIDYALGVLVYKIIDPAETTTEENSPLE